MLSLASLACPSCALGEGQGGSDSILVVVVLVTLPLAIGLLTGFIVGLLVKRSSSSG